MRQCNLMHFSNFFDILSAATQRIRRPDTTTMHENGFDRATTAAILVQAFPKKRNKALDTTTQIQSQRNKAETNEFTP